VSFASDDSDVKSADEKVAITPILKKVISRPSGWPIRLAL